MPSDFYSRCGCGRLLGARPGVAEFDALLGGTDFDDTLDENAWRVDVVRINLSGGHQMLDFRNRDLCSRRHHRVEVPRCLAIDEIARGLALPGMDDREVGEQAALHQICFAVEFLDLLAFGNQRADPGFGVEGWNTRPARSDALGERTLRIEFELQFAREILLRE